MQTVQALGCANKGCLMPVPMQADGTGQQGNTGGMLSPICGSTLPNTLQASGETGSGQRWPAESGSGYSGVWASAKRCCSVSACYHMQMGVWTPHRSSQWAGAQPAGTAQHSKVLAPTRRHSQHELRRLRQGPSATLAACSAHLSRRCSSAAASPCALLRPQHAPAWA